MKKKNRTAQISAPGAHHSSDSSSGRNVAPPAALAPGRKLHIAHFSNLAYVYRPCHSAAGQALSKLCPFYALNEATGAF